MKVLLEIADNDFKDSLERRFELNDIKYSVRDKDELIRFREEVMDYKNRHDELVRLQVEYSSNEDTINSLCEKKKALENRLSMSADDESGSAEKLRERDKLVRTIESQNDAIIDRKDIKEFLEYRVPEEKISKTKLIGLVTLSVGSLGALIFGWLNYEMGYIYQILAGLGVVSFFAVPYTLTKIYDYVIPFRLKRANKKLKELEDKNLLDNKRLEKLLTENADVYLEYERDKNERKRIEIKISDLGYEIARLLDKNSRIGLRISKIQNNSGLDYLELIKKQALLESQGYEDVPSVLSFDGCLEEEKSDDLSGNVKKRGERYGK